MHVKYKLSQLVGFPLKDHPGKQSPHQYKQKGDQVVPVWMGIIYFDYFSHSQSNDEWEQIYSNSEYDSNIETKEYSVATVAP